MYKFNQIEKLIKNNIGLIKQTEIIKQANGLTLVFLTVELQPF